MMQKIVVGLGERSYPIWIGADILLDVRAQLDQVNFPKQVALITNSTISELYADTVIKSIARGNYKVDLIRLPDGEEYKTLDTVSHIYDVLIERGFDRHSGLIALGGGVVGDITGYAAATYLRGIPFMQIPTTLLSQVDSSVGGKTGVNHPQGKNLIGAFYQPKCVLIDVMVLSSLTERDYHSGMAEVIKYGIISDRVFFEWLREKQSELVQRHANTLIHAVKRSCQIKANVVENDEKEQGLRAILNLGHTFGHAIESLAGYGVVKHGEAVAIGMVMAAKVAQQKGLCSLREVDAIKRLIGSFSLPTEPPDFSAEEYASVMRRDKKVKHGVVRLVLNNGIGSAKLCEIENLEQILIGVLH